MLDLKLLQKNPEVVAAALAKRHSPLNMRTFEELDNKRRELLAQVEALKAERNRASAEVARLKRTYIGPVKLGMLQPGEYRELTPAELSAIRGYMNKAVNRRQNAEGEKAAAERGSRPAKKAPVKPAGKDRTPLGRR